MSVVFDVLDSLYSIRNVEDLKKRWAEDCKRPQTQSYKAVEMFVGFFENYSDKNSFLFILRVANFTMRYREAVATHICPIEEQVWVMPYIRYAERLKAFVSYHRDFDFIPDDFAKNCYEVLHKTHSHFDAYYHIAFTKDRLAEYQKNPKSYNVREDLLRGFGHLYSIATSGSEPDQAFCDLLDIIVPWGNSKDAANHNPWGLNPNPEECSYDMFNEEDLNMATIYPYFNCPLLYNGDAYPISGCLESHLDELISKFGDYKEIKDNELAEAISQVVTSNSNLDTRFQIIRNICNNKLPCSFKIILSYDIETIFVSYLKKEFQKSLSKHEMTLLFDKVKAIKTILPEDIAQYCYTKLFVDEIYEATIREEERKKVLFEMSHSIKNLVASVSEPLVMLQDELTGKQRITVKNALAGADLIRDLAVGVHMSMRGEAGAWRKDVKEPGFGATTFDKIILDAMRHAVSNMFDGKYFSLFLRNYFGRDRETFKQAQNEWKTAETVEQTFACINKYFFDLKIDCHDTEPKVAVGDRDGTATKLLILFQELFLNAVKYSSFTERAKRFVKLDITITADKWNISISNSAVDRRNVKSSGIGLSVIKNFATLFEASYNATFAADVYTATMKFFLNK